MKLSLIFTSIVVLLTSVHSKTKHKIASDPEPPTFEAEVDYTTDYEEPAETALPLNTSTMSCANFFMSLSPEQDAATYDSGLPGYPLVGGGPASCGTCVNITNPETGVSAFSMIVDSPPGSNSYRIGTSTLRTLTATELDWQPPAPGMVATNWILQLYGPSFCG